VFDGSSNEFGDLLLATRFDDERERRIARDQVLWLATLS
jgi:hypothetical protein